MCRPLFINSCPESTGGARSLSRLIFDRPGTKVIVLRIILIRIPAARVTRPIELSLHEPIVFFVAIGARLTPTLTSTIVVTSQRQFYHAVNVPGMLVVFIVIHN